MRCPFCRDGDSRVLDSRDADDGAVTRRRRACQACGRRFTHGRGRPRCRCVKRNGTSRAVQPREGRRRRPQGLPGPSRGRRRLRASRPAGRGHAAVRAAGSGEVARPRRGAPRSCCPLRELDEVAYLRFASVYRGFDSLADFEREIAGAPGTSATGSSSRRPRHRPDHAGPSTPGRPRRRPPGHEPQQLSRRPSLSTDTARHPGHPDTPRPHHPHVLGSPHRGVHHNESTQEPGMTETVQQFGSIARQQRQRARGKSRAPTSARRPHPHHPRHPPVRRGDLGAPRRRDDQLAGRQHQLRAAWRGVPGRLVGECGEHRHHQVLPRRGRQRHPRVEPASSSSTGWWPGTATAGEEHGYLATRRGRRGLRPRADLGAPAPGVLLQQPGVVQRRDGGAAAGVPPASSSPSTTRWTRSSTGTARRG